MTKSDSLYFLRYGVISILQLFADQVVIPYVVKLIFVFLIKLFLYKTKSQDKNKNILRTKRALKAI